MARTSQAVVIRPGKESSDTYKLVKDSITTPTPGPGQALVKVQYVAQNPTDVKSFDNKVFGDGHILGCDFYGTVVEVGSNVTRIAKGDVVAGLIWGGEIKGLGGYSEYTIADQNICYKVPPSISGDAASTIPLASGTAWLALFAKTCLNIDRKNASSQSVLIWGGSSSVGLFAIQLAAIYGIKVVTTCSPRNFDLVRSYGASEAFDYRDEKVVEKIRAAVPGLHYVFDTIGEDPSSTIASQALTENAPGYLCTVRPGKACTENVTKQTVVSDVLVWTVFLKDHSYRDILFWPASKDDHELATELFDNLPVWLEQGKIKPNATKVFDGLDSVTKGFQEFRDGKVSAYKIVYKL
ncbi:chaperonin 10-like protein [Talaromyces proteolyticus]|uniref:Chaperonin 10-like protein n=1 Tax=Talaromyces proteolyticus TaxID=1131652 RepID=A0AAD4KLK5_9EURO|nr:chaperonin 10-like protein [Talaromyces proteolyticus]KAH8695493.1 chaperonin 10-like protein [Talaromyces proteolyticus]